MSRIGRIGQALYSGEVQIDFVGRRRTWYLISAIVILIAIGALLFRGLNFSIDFRGGVDYKAPVPAAAQPASSQIVEVREAVVDTGRLGSSQPIVTSIGENKLDIQTPPLSKEAGQEVRAAIAESLGIDQSKITFTVIGPTWGDQITTKGLTSLIVFLLLVSAVIWLYFREWRMAVSAISALLHDLVITVGVYALIGFEVTPASVIGLLTILGYSLYDTVVVFDKVRENTAGITAANRVTYSHAANLAVNQTLVRSVNTTIVALLPVAGILFVGAGLLGAGTLKDLSLALFIGMAAGAYSSVFIASPLLCSLKEREPAMKALRARVEKRQQQSTDTISAEQVSQAPANGGAPVTVGVAGPPEVHAGSSGRTQPARRPRSARSGRKPKSGR